MNAWLRMVLPTVNLNLSVNAWLDPVGTNRTVMLCLPPDKSVNLSPDWPLNK